MAEEISTPGALADQAVWRDLQILEELDKDAEISQRNLADRMGIALGLANRVLHRLIRKGLVKTRSLPANRLAYYLTPKGFSEKARLTINYVKLTTSFFCRVRQAINEKLIQLKQQRGIHRIAIYGANELGEAAFLSIQESGLPFSGIYDNNRVGEPWLGHTVAVLDGQTRIDAILFAEGDSEEFSSLPGFSDTHILDLHAILAKDLQAFAGTMNR